MPTKRKKTYRLRKQQQAERLTTHKRDLPKLSNEESERLRQECFKRAWAQKAAREADSEDEFVDE